MSIPGFRGTVCIPGWAIAMSCWLAPLRVGCTAGTFGRNGADGRDLLPHESVCSVGNRSLLSFRRRQMRSAVSLGDRGVCHLVAR